MTMYLPLGAHVVTDEEVAAARERLNRLEHNPDALLGEVEFDSAEERAAPSRSPPRRPSWSSAIAAPDADKKALGAAHPRGQRRARRRCSRRCERSWTPRAGVARGAGRGVGDPDRPHVPVLLLVAAGGRRQGAVGSGSPAATFARGRRVLRPVRLWPTRAAGARIARFAEKPHPCERIQPCPCPLLIRPLHRLRHLRRRVPDQLLRPRGRRPPDRPDDCTECGTCVDACPNGAISHGLARDSTCSATRGPGSGPGPSSLLGAQPRGPIRSLM